MSEPQPRSVHDRGRSLSIASGKRRRLQAEQQTEPHAKSLRMMRLQVKTLTCLVERGRPASGSLGEGSRSRKGVEGLSASSWLH